MRGKDQSFRAAPKDVACQRYYHAAKLDNGDIDTQTIEKELSQIEGSGSSVMKALLSGVSPTQQQRNDFALFLTSQDFRSPRRRQEFADMLLGIKHQKFPESTVKSIENYIREVTKASVGDREFDRTEISAKSGLSIDGGGTISVEFEDTIRALSAAKHFAPVVSDMDWHLFRAPQGSKFIICDNPVQLFESPETLTKYTGPAYWRRGSCVSIPLSPNACLVASHPSRTKGAKWPPRFTVREAKGSDVRFFNQLQLIGCLNHVYATSDFSWLGKKCAELPEPRTQLSFMPVDAEKKRISVKTKR